PEPDFILGDFNMVEEATDSLPHHKDPNTVTNAMFNFKNVLHLCDGWCQMYPESKEYTFLHTACGSQSHLDRIYVPNDKVGSLARWQIEPSGIPTDHQLISVKYSDPKLPFVGRGRWQMPLHILKDQETMDKIQQLGKDTEDAIERYKYNWSDSTDPQLIFKAFKDIVRGTCRQ
ncbi:hypothetical protein B0H10DRAFT_1845626, partial [Mycena sp. CBHHK59/15]